MRHKTKKIHIMIFFIMILSFIAIASEIITIAPADTTAARNSTGVSVPILLNNNEPVAGFDMKLNYSTFLIFEGINLTDRMQNATVDVNEIEPGLLAIAAIIPDSITAGNGTVFNVVFGVDENALPGNYNMNITDVLMGNIDIEVLPFTAGDAIFTILES